MSDTNDDRLDRHAAALRTASTERHAIEPLTATDSDLTVADAYAIQLANVDRLLGSGRRIVGHKVGLTSKAMQNMLGVHEPDFGVLLDDMVVEDGADIPVTRLLQPKVESEIGLWLGEDLAGPGVTTETALRAIASAVPALEIIDSRIAEWRIGLVDTIADNGSSGMVVVGSTPTPIEGLDLRLIGCVLERNGEFVDCGVGAAALGHPAACVAWLANKLSEFGESLRAGQLVMPGAVHGAVPVERGDTVRAEFAQLGTVSARFVGA